jgi:hypothetical protein
VFEVLCLAVAQSPVVEPLSYRIRRGVEGNAVSLLVYVHCRLAD